MQSVFVATLYCANTCFGGLSGVPSNMRIEAYGIPEKSPLYSLLLYMLRKKTIEFTFELTRFKSTVIISLSRPSSPS